MNLARAAFIAFILLAATAPIAGAVEVQPNYSAELLGGQYLYNGRSASLSGNAAGYAAPAVLLDDRWTLVPILSSRYQGTKQFVDLVGGGTLFSERMDHRIAARGIYKPADSKWRIKPSLGYGVELLKETRDESWGAGLFDARTLDMGVEAEYEFREPYSIRAALDLARTEFPNYESLESKVARDFAGGALRRELAEDRVLDHTTLMLTLAGTFDAGAADLEARLAVARQAFGRQHIVGSDGQLSAATRADVVVGAELAARREFELRPEALLRAGLGFGLRARTSNQNGFDARRLVYQAGYYNSSEFSLKPEAELSLGDERQPVLVSLSGGWTRRRYAHRRAQDDSGAYGADELVQREWSLAFSASYPMAPRLRLLFSVQAGGASSNQGFEQYYGYGWSATNVLMGLRFDY